MKTKEQIQRYHDIIAAMTLLNVKANHIFIPMADMPIIMAQLEVLCSILEHDHDGVHDFNKSIDELESMLKNTQFDPANFKKKGHLPDLDNFLKAAQASKQDKNNIN